MKSCNAILGSVTSKDRNNDLWFMYFWSLSGVTAAYEHSCLYIYIRIYTYIYIYIDIFVFIYIYIYIVCIFTFKLTSMP